MVDLLECDDYEDFTKYTGGTFFSVVHPDDRDPMKKNSTASSPGRIIRDRLTSFPSAW